MSDEKLGRALKAALDDHKTTCAACGGPDDGCDAGQSLEHLMLDVDPEAYERGDAERSANIARAVANDAIIALECAAREDEREECAKLADSDERASKATVEHARLGDDQQLVWREEARAKEARKIAGAIRARGSK